ncbi:MAG TPA: aldo/keto reductase, partial [Gemmatimonadales bacterium]|nr:aldo/keto reductase [Gemmatimonadales bacterium]
FLQREQVTEPLLEKVRRLNELARTRGQSLAQLALVWVLRHPQVTTVLVGASRVAQLEDAVGALTQRELSAEELKQIERILAS